MIGNFSRIGCSFILLMILLCSHPAPADTNSVDSSLRPHGPWFETIDQVKTTVVFLGVVDEKGNPNYKGTACVLQVSGIFHLLTAKHMVVEQKDGAFTGKRIDQDLVIFFNRTDGSVGKRAIQTLKTDFKVDWIFHHDDRVDLALIPFGIDLKSDDVRAIPDDLFLGPEALHELDEVFFLSYQPELKANDKVRPIYRSGTVSLLLPDKTFILDGFAFPGNSGSPVFVRPRPIGFGPEAAPISPSPNSGRFVGIIGGYIPYREAAISPQTGRIRVIFEENAGLSKVWSVDLVRQIIASKEFVDQLSKVRR